MDREGLIKRILEVAKTPTTNKQKRHWKRFTDPLPQKSIEESAGSLINNPRFREYYAEEYHGEKEIEEVAIDYLRTSRALHNLEKRRRGPSKRLMNKEYIATT